MEIRPLAPSERPAAMQLVWDTFQRFEAPEYPPEGTEAFRRFVADETSWDTLEAFGAFENGRLYGVLAARENRSHIALFFVAADRPAAGNRTQAVEPSAQHQPGRIHYCQRLPLCGPCLPPSRLPTPFRRTVHRRHTIYPDALDR